MPLLAGRVPVAATAVLRGDQRWRQPLSHQAYPTTSLRCTRTIATLPSPSSLNSVWQILLKMRYHPAAPAPPRPHRPSGRVIPKPGEKLRSRM